MPDSFHVLIVEDDAFMAEWVALHLRPLREAFPAAEFQIVGRWAEAQSCLISDPPPSIMLLDLNLPDSTMIQSVERGILAEERCPVLIITGDTLEAVREKLGTSNIEVLRKGPDLWQDSTIIRAMVRTFVRWRGDLPKRRSDKLNAILDRLSALGYGHTP